MDHHDGRMGSGWLKGMKADNEEALGSEGRDTRGLEVSRVQDSFYRSDRDQGSFRPRGHDNCGQRLLRSRGQGSP